MITPNFLPNMANKGYSQGTWFANNMQATKWCTFAHDMLLQRSHLQTALRGLIVNYGGNIMIAF